jgi:hypothetical protein
VILVATLFAYLHIYSPLREAVQVSHLLIEGLVNRDRTQILATTGGCTECAHRLETKWTSLVSELGTIRAWQFQRVIIATEAGSRQKLPVAKAKWWYEVEYKMVFDKGRREVVVVIDRSGGRSYPADIQIRQVFVAP